MNHPRRRRKPVRLRLRSLILALLVFCISAMWWMVHLHGSLMNANSQSSSSSGYLPFFSSLSSSGGPEFSSCLLIQDDNHFLVSRYGNFVSEMSPASSSSDLEGIEKKRHTSDHYKKGNLIDPHSHKFSNFFLGRMACIPLPCSKLAASDYRARSKIIDIPGVYLKSMEGQDGNPAVERFRLYDEPRIS